MSRFASVLQQADGSLELPQATKSRILLEMAGDLEDLYQHHLGQGLDEAEARRRAEDAFAASDEALKHLARIHESWPSRIADRWTDPVGTIWEKVLLVALVLAYVALSIKVVSQKSFFLLVSPFVWPIAGLALAALAVALWKLRQMVIRRPPDVRRLRTGLGVLLFAAAASLSVTASGFVYHLHQYSVRAADQAPEAVFRMYGVWALLTSSMTTLGLVTAVLSALVWFVLSHLVARIERREAAALLA